MLKGEADDYCVRAKIGNIIMKICNVKINVCAILPYGELIEYHIIELELNLFHILLMTFAVQ
jgi:hypothetical protein